MRHFIFSSSSFNKQRVGYYFFYIKEISLLRSWVYIYYGIGWKGAAINFSFIIRIFLKWNHFCFSWLFSVLLFPRTTYMLETKKKKKIFLQYLAAKSSPFMRPFDFFRKKCIILFSIRYFESWAKSKCL
jgi:hypothetical protein